MTRSMTAYAEADVTVDGLSLHCEIRAVNHRYLEPGFRLPEGLRKLEPALRDQVKNRLQRGKLDCSLRVDGNADETDRIELDPDQLGMLLNATGEILELAGDQCGALDPLEILRWPGVQCQRQVDEDELLHASLSLFADTLDLLVDAREREGQALALLIHERAQQVRDCCELIRENVPEILESMQQRIRERLEDAAADIDETRIEAELVLLANRMDVEEELDRLHTHLDEISQILRSNEGPVGRRLDFLMQELNREANTICSKSAAADVTSQGVEIKVLIEQMREQIQNIE